MLHTFRALRLGLLAAAFVASLIPAQEHPAGMVFEPRTAGSGPLTNRLEFAATVWSDTLSAEDATSVQVVFQSLVLESDEDRLIISSELDGLTQAFTRQTFPAWRLHSAWFNGSAVSVSLSLASGSSGSVQIAGIVAGRPFSSVDTHCGADDRNLHIDLRVCRIVPSATFACSFPNPCAATGFLIGNLPVILSARHVAVAQFPAPVGPPLPLFQLAEFGILQSTATGAIQHGAPASQFPIDPNQVVMSAASVLGDDWVVAGLLPNATGLTAIQVQGAGFNLANALPAAGTTVRVTGYGLDNTPLDNNQARQSSTGPFNGACANVLHHAVDTENGNSGSPIINTSDDTVIGIHTAGGCGGAGTSNRGTSILNAGLQAAIQGMFQPRWERNSDRCHLDIDGQPDGGGYGPVDVAKAEGESATLNLASVNAGYPWDLGITASPGYPLVPAGGGGITLLDGQIVNLDLYDPGLFWFNGLTFSVPFAPFSLTFPAPAGIPEIRAQKAIVDPIMPSGISLSAAARLRILAIPVIAGPTGDDSAVTVPVCDPAVGAPAAMPVYGYAYTAIHVISNGRVLFGGADTDFSPTVAEALLDHPFVGCWMDLYPPGGGNITITRPLANVLQVNYNNLPYYAAAGTSTSFSIRMSASTGVIALQNLTGIAAYPNVVPWNQMFMGISRGNTGATNPGATAFAIGPAQPPPPNVNVNVPANATDMIYSYGQAGAPGGGLNTLTFVPLPSTHAAYPNYGWFGQ